MNRFSKIILAAVLACSGTLALHAQNANPITANLKASWENIHGLISKMAEEMPEADYRFKPTPQIQDFGQRMAHVVGFNLRNCAMLQGQQKMAHFSKAPTKAEVMAAIKESGAECNAMFNSLNDAELMKMVNAGRGGPRMKLAVIEGNLLEHSQEVYGYSAVYLRLKGMVPPSSARNEMGGGRGMKH